MYSSGDASGGVYAASNGVYAVDDEDGDDLLRAEEQFAEDMQAGLSDDAPWKRIQQNTFTRWANEHLKVVNRQIVDLQYDLSDGLLLIALIEILSQKKLPRHNKKTTFRSQKLENVSVALDFLENNEQIKLVNIDASHIVDGRLKLILGLIWTLILHYYISLPRWESAPTEEHKPGRDPTPKQKLMGWVKNMLPPDLPITNFTTDWNDGRAIGALVDACAPGLYPDWVDNDPRDALKNTRDAMDLADEWLGIPQLIRPEEMIDPNVDDRSMMTYLSQYPSAKVRMGAPLRPKLNAALTNCYGKGIEPTGNFVAEPTDFFVETKQAGVGRLSVILINPRGQQEPCSIALQNDPNRTFKCTYTPSMEGQYKAIVKYADTEVPNSPFSPYIDRHPANVNECRAYGPGLEGQVGVDKPTWFEVDHSGAGPGRLDGSVVDPIYLQEIPIQIKPVDEGKSRCEYTPRMEGRHRVNLNYDGQPIPGSPFIIEAARAEEPIHFQAYGFGIQPKGVLVDDNAEFTVVADQIPVENIMVTVLGPDGYEVPSSVVKSTPQKFACTYVPKQAGPHRVLVTYMGSHIPNSPFNVFVDAPSVARTTDAPERVRAYGPGLQTGTVRKPSTFVVETNGNPADLSFSIEGPDKVDMQCQDNHDGTVDVSYVPAAPGDHEIHVLNKGKDIPSSPFTAWIEPLPAHTAKQHPAAPSEVPSKVKVYGPGVEPGNKVNNPTHFVVDCSEAGPGDVSVALTDPRGRDVELRIDPLDNAFNVAYTPLVPGPHTVAVLCGNQEIAQSPITVDILPGAEKVDLSKIYPEEYNPNPIVNQPNVIKINTQRAGPVDPQAVDADVTPVEPPAGTIPVARRRPSGKADVVPTGTGFGINYSVPAPGPYDVTPCVHGVPLEPIRVDAVEPVNPANVRVFGPGLIEGRVNRPAEFTVDTAGAGPGELRVAVEGHSKPRLTREDNSDDESCRVTYVPTSPGEHNISVLFDDQHVPGSPFHPNISPDQDVNRVRAYGPGVDPVKALNVGVPTEFTVDAQPIDKTGSGDVRCSILSPRGSQANAQVFNNRNGSFSVKYAPHETGNLDVDVRYDGYPIPGSPFPVVSNAPHVEDTRPYQRPADTISAPPSGQVRCFGPGLEGAYTKEPTEFTIDTSDAPGLGQLNVTIHGHGDAPLTMKNKMDNLCIIEYVPSKPGQYQISVTFNDQPIQGSPFSVSVCDRLNENQVFIGMPDEPMHVGEPFELNIDGRRAGPGVPAVNVIDPYGAQHSVPSHPVAAGRTVSGGGEQYLAEFTPVTPGVHQFSVTWSGRSIPSCPFNVEAISLFDVSQISVVGPGVMRTVGATIPTSFNINTKSTQYHDINVNIRGGPNNSTVRNVLSDNHDGTYTVHYVPPGEVGTYSISVLCGKQHVPGSPYSISVVPCGDPSKCRISGSGIRTTVPIGQQCMIHVDASDAGHGAVTATIVSQTSGAPLEFDIIESEDQGAYDIIYVPSSAGVYAIQIYFGGQPIPNGSFVVQAGVEEHYTISQADYQKQFADTTRAHEPINFRLPVGGSISDVSAEVHTPSYRIVTPIIQDNHDGTISIKYHPNEPGEHVLSVYYQGIPVQGSPYRFTVDQVHDGYVTAYGPGLSGGISGQPCNFKIITKDAGTGSLAVAVEGPSKAEIRCKDNKDGTCDATYWPMAPGDYVVTVKYGGKHIAGSPFRARISPCTDVLLDDVHKTWVPSDVDTGYSPSFLRSPVVPRRSPIEDASNTKRVSSSADGPSWFSSDYQSDPEIAPLDSRRVDGPLRANQWQLDNDTIDGNEGQPFEMIQHSRLNEQPNERERQRCANEDSSTTKPKRFRLLREALSPTSMLNREGLALIGYPTPEGQGDVEFDNRERARWLRDEPEVAPYYRDYPDVGGKDDLHLKGDNCPMNERISNLRRSSDVKSTELEPKGDHDKSSSRKDNLPIKKASIEFKGTPLGGADAIHPVSRNAIDPSVVGQVQTQEHIGQLQPDSFGKDAKFERDHNASTDEAEDKPKTVDNANEINLGRALFPRKDRTGSQTSGRGEEHRGSSDDGDDDEFLPSDGDTVKSPGGLRHVKLESKRESGHCEQEEEWLIRVEDSGPGSSEDTFNQFKLDGAPQEEHSRFSSPITDVAKVSSKDLSKDKVEKCFSSPESESKSLAESANILSSTTAAASPSAERVRKAIENFERRAHGPSEDQMDGSSESSFPARTASILPVDATRKRQKPLRSPSNSPHGMDSYSSIDQPRDITTGRGKKIMRQISTQDGNRPEKGDESEAGTCDVSKDSIRPKSLTSLINSDMDDDYCLVYGRPNERFYPGEFESNFDRSATAPLGDKGGKSPTGTSNDRDFGSDVPKGGKESLLGDGPFDYCRQAQSDDENGQPAAFFDVDPYAGRDKGRTPSTRESLSKVDMPHLMEQGIRGLGMPADSEDQHPLDRYRQMPDSIDQKSGLAKPTDASIRISSPNAQTSVTGQEYGVDGIKQEGPWNLSTNVRARELNPDLLEHHADFSRLDSAKPSASNAVNEQSMPWDYQRSFPGSCAIPSSLSGTTDLLSAKPNVPELDKTGQPHHKDLNDERGRLMELASYDGIPGHQQFPQAASDAHLEGLWLKKDARAVSPRQAKHLDKRQLTPHDGLGSQKKGVLGEDNPRYMSFDNAGHFVPDASQVSNDGYLPQQSDASSMPEIDASIPLSDEPSSQRVGKIMAESTIPKEGGGFGAPKEEDAESDIEQVDVDLSNRGKRNRNIRGVESGISSEESDESVYNEEFEEHRRQVHSLDEVSKYVHSKSVRRKKPKSIKKIASDDDEIPSVLHPEDAGVSKTQDISIDGTDLRGKDAFPSKQGRLGGRTELELRDDTGAKPVRRASDTSSPGKIPSHSSMAKRDLALKEDGDIRHPRRMSDISVPGMMTSGGARPTGNIETELIRRALAMPVLSKKISDNSKLDTDIGLPDSRAPTTRVKSPHAFVPQRQLITEDGDATRLFRPESDAPLHGAGVNQYVEPPDYGRSQKPEHYSVEGPDIHSKSSETKAERNDMPREDSLRTADATGQPLEPKGEIPVSGVGISRDGEPSDYHDTERLKGYSGSQGMRDQGDDLLKDDYILTDGGGILPFRHVSEIPVSAARIVSDRKLAQYGDTGGVKDYSPSRRIKDQINGMPGDDSLRRDEGITQPLRRKGDISVSGAKIGPDGKLADYDDKRGPKDYSPSRRMKDQIDGMPSDDALLKDEGLTRALRQKKEIPVTGTRIGPDGKLAHYDDKRGPKDYSPSRRMNDQRDGVPCDDSLLKDERSTLPLKRKGEIPVTGARTGTDGKLSDFDGTRVLKGYSPSGRIKDQINAMPKDDVLLNNKDITYPFKRKGEIPVSVARIGTDVKLADYDDTRGLKGYSPTRRMKDGPDGKLGDFDHTRGLRDYSPSRRMKDQLDSKRKDDALLKDEGITQPFRRQGEIPMSVAIIGTNGKVADYDDTRGLKSYSPCRKMKDQRHGIPTDDSLLRDEGITQPFRQKGEMPVPDVEISKDDKPSIYHDTEPPFRRASKIPGSSGRTGLDGKLADYDPTMELKDYSPSKRMKDERDGIHTDDSLRRDEGITQPLRGKGDISVSGAKIGPDGKLADYDDKRGLKRYSPNRRIKDQIDGMPRDDALLRDPGITQLLRRKDEIPGSVPGFSRDGKPSDYQDTKRLKGYPGSQEMKDQGHDFLKDDDTSTDGGGRRPFRRVSEIPVSSGRTDRDGQLADYDDKRGVKGYSPSRRMKDQRDSMDGDDFVLSDEDITQPFRRKGEIPMSGVGISRDDKPTDYHDTERPFGRTGGIPVSGTKSGQDGKLADYDHTRGLKDYSPNRRMKDQRDGMPGDDAQLMDESITQPLLRRGEIPVSSERIGPDGKLADYDDTTVLKGYSPSRRMKTQRDGTPRDDSLLTNEGITQPLRRKGEISVTDVRIAPDGKPLYYPDTEMPSQRMKIQRNGMPCNYSHLADDGITEPLRRKGKVSLPVIGIGRDGKHADYNSRDRPDSYSHIQRMKNKIGDMPGVDYPHTVGSGSQRWTRKTGVPVSDEGIVTDDKALGLRDARRPDVCSSSWGMKDDTDGMPFSDPLRTDEGKIHQRERKGDIPVSEEGAYSDDQRSECIGIDNIDGDAPTSKVEGLHEDVPQDGLMYISDFERRTYRRVSEVLVSGLRITRVGEPTNYRDSERQDSSPEYEIEDHVDNMSQDVSVTTAESRTLPLGHEGETPSAVGLYDKHSYCSDTETPDGHLPSYSIKHQSVHRPQDDLLLPPKAPAQPLTSEGKKSTLGVGEISDGDYVDYSDTRRHDSYSPVYDSLSQHDAVPQHGSLLKEHSGTSLLEQKDPAKIPNIKIGRDGKASDNPDTERLIGYSGSPGMKDQGNDLFRDDYILTGEGGIRPFRHLSEIPVSGARIVSDPKLAQYGDTGGVKDYSPSRRIKDQIDGMPDDDSLRRDEGITQPLRRKNDISVSGARIGPDGKLADYDDKRGPKDYSPSRRMKDQIDGMPRDDALLKDEGVTRGFRQKKEIPVTGTRIGPDGKLAHYDGTRGLKGFSPNRRIKDQIDGMPRDDALLRDAGITQPLRRKDEMPGSVPGFSRDGKPLDYHDTKRLKGYLGSQEMKDQGDDFLKDDDTSTDGGGRRPFERVSEIPVSNGRTGRDGKLAEYDDTRGVKDYSPSRRMKHQRDSMPGDDTLLRDGGITQPSRRNGVIPMPDVDITKDGKPSDHHDTERPLRGTSEVPVSGARTGPDGKLADYDDKRGLKDYSSIRRDSMHGDDSLLKGTQPCRREYDIPVSDARTGRGDKLSDYRDIKISDGYPPSQAMKDDRDAFPGKDSLLPGDSRRQRLRRNGDTKQRDGYVPRQPFKDDDGMPTDDSLLTDESSRLLVRRRGGVPVSGIESSCYPKVTEYRVIDDVSLRSRGDVPVAPVKFGLSGKSRDLSVCEKPDAYSVPSGIGSVPSLAPIAVLASSVGDRPYRRSNDIPLLYDETSRMSGAATKHHLPVSYVDSTIKDVGYDGRYIHPASSKPGSAEFRRIVQRSEHSDLLSEHSCSTDDLKDLLDSYHIRMPTIPPTRHIGQGSDRLSRAHSQTTVQRFVRRHTYSTVDTVREEYFENLSDADKVGRLKKPSRTHPTYAQDQGRLSHQSLTDDSLHVNTGQVAIQHQPSLGKPHLPLGQRVLRDGDTMKPSRFHTSGVEPFSKRNVPTHASNLLTRHHVEGNLQHAVPKLTDEFRGEPSHRVDRTLSDVLRINIAFQLPQKAVGEPSVISDAASISPFTELCSDEYSLTANAIHPRVSDISTGFHGELSSGSSVIFTDDVVEAGEYVATDQRMQALGTSNVDFSDAARVHAYGPGLDEAFVNVANNFIVDSREAGNGSLSIAIEGPSKANIYCPSNEDGTCHVTYKVSEPGRYIINIKFAESSVPGSPFTVNVAGPDISGGSGRAQPLASLTQSDSSQFDRRMYRSFVLGDTRVQSLQMQSNVSTSSSRVGSMCQLCIPIPGVQSKDLYAYITAPSSESRPCEVVDLDDQCKSIRFTPMEVGAHLINITRASDRTHIAGSPYQFTVGTSAIQHDGSGAHNVRVSGTGVERGIANVPCEFNVYTRESGPGSLVITVEGPTNAEINFQEVQDGIGLVSYTCPGPGEYSVVVKFNEEHVPNSPFTVHIEPNPSDERCITIEDIHMPGSRQIYQVNVPISFRLSSKHGVSYSTHVEAYVVSASALREPCQVQYKRENGQDFHVISFVPKEAGVHRVTVTCDNREIPGCPMEFNVGAVSTSGTTRSELSSDSAKVTAHGRGLYTGTVDQNCEFFVDTSKAGTGLLAVVVEGPSKVQLDCKEARGGYNISFFASAPGNYSVAIQFAGQPIPGSPFTCRMVDDDMGTNLDSMSGRQHGTVDTSFLSSDQSRTFGSTSSIRQHQTISSSTFSSGSPGRHQMAGDGRWNRQQSPGVTSMSPGWTYTKAGGDATMSGQSQPQKVRTYGSGIVRAKRDEQTEFTVDATAAGRNMLMVGILGPTRPCEEVIIKHLGKNVYTVSYIVRETGNYVLIVKWGESHIPGSPFYIEVP